ncbi:Na+/H+ antiporter subunit E [Lamprobacter modestohalophilus]|uniref:Na+/H+ antiporter subunit E n=1 Tax=Lamprobacter modestohalophilus TaxID=1064514 RepID=UPI002ADEE66E|nr:Na+/H+ antiporter subunit E [Lamprobacter modestohalophilus]MEA1050161.1 Na+/H+ antiporter subunit E [Lamprobacter modestohalophilus]
MKPLLPHPILSLMLLGLWLLLVNSISPGQILLGALLAWLIPLYTARFWTAQIHIRRPLLLLRLTGTVLVDILIANIAVARLIVGPRARIQPGFIRMPLRVKGNVSVSLLANIITLTPGTLSASLSPDRSELIIHALQGEDSVAIIAEIRERYEQPLLDALEQT